MAGDGDIEIGTGGNLTLAQKAGTISTFRGKISDQSDSTFTVTGGGTLILAGDTDQLSVRELNIVDGQVSLDGSELLNDSIAVFVGKSEVDNTLGTLAIIDAKDASGPRTESIWSLGGAGNINLGSNTLNIQNGGNFDGQYFGTGAVNVVNGSFTINNSLTSEEGGLTVSNAAGTTVAQGTNVQVKTVIVNENGLLKIAGAGNDENGLATVATDSLILNSNSILQMGSGAYEPGAETHSVVEADEVLLSGEISGSGTILAPGITISGTSPEAPARVTPGASPGVLAFLGDRTVFGNNSLLTIEVVNRDIEAGVGYDQIRFQTDGAVSLEGNTVLEIVDLDEGSGYSLDNYALGKVTPFAVFDPLAITGKFDSVSYYPLIQSSGNFVVNLATGSLVGLGDNTLVDAVSNANQAAMLAGLRVSTQGDVDQYYGGQFVENLTAAWADGGDLNAVFNKASPEVYAGLSGSAEASAMNSTQKWVNRFILQEGQHGTFFDTTQSDFGSKDEVGGFQRYGVQTNNTILGFNVSSPNLTFLFSLGTAATKLESEYLHGSGQGMAMSLAVAGRVLGKSDMFWTAGIQHANLKLDGHRFANNGFVNFSDVSAKATQFHLGVEYHTETYIADLGVKANVEFGDSESQEFSEAAGPSNTLDAMSVSKVSNKYARLNFGLQAAGDVISGTKILVGVDLSVPFGGETPVNVSASYDNGQAIFDVNARGLDATTVSASVGVDQKITDNGVVSARIGAQKKWDGDMGLSASVSARINF